MKKVIFILILSLIPVLSFSQNNKKEKDDVIISINLSKMGRLVDKVSKTVKDEIELFKEEIDTNLSEERKNEIKDNAKKAKETAKGLIKGLHDEFHKGFVSGLRGEKYTYNKEE